jgi:type I restriction enzyme S subunit
LKPKKGHDIDYLTEYLESLDYTSYNTGTAQPKLNRETCESIPVRIPPFGEQQRIGEIARQWDRAIELTGRLIAAKQKRKAALMQQLLTGKVRFRDFVKSDEVVPTRYGNIPKDWRYVHIGDVAREVSKRNTGGASHRVLSCTKYDGLVDSLTYFGKRVFSDDLSTYKVVRRHQFAYATNHIEEGSLGYQDLLDVALISPMYTVFKTNEQVDDSFLYKLLKSNLYVHIYQVNTSASVDRRGSLRWSQFSHIRMPLPSLDEQRAIAQVIDSQQREIDVQRQKVDALRRQKKGLMQQLLTGKVRVKSRFEPPGE